MKREAKMGGFSAVRMQSVHSLAEGRGREDALQSRFDGREMSSQGRKVKVGRDMRRHKPA